MKRVITMIVLSLITFMFCSCTNEVTIPQGVKPTRKFSVVDYIADDAIFQGDATLTISGKAEPGVVIVCTLYDNHDAQISKSYCAADDKGEWNLEIDTPSISQKVYSILVSDALNIFETIYKNIRFGEVWLIIGDKIKTQCDINEESFFEKDKNKMIYSNGVWLPSEKNFGDFEYTLLEKLSKDFNNWNRIPLALVCANVEQSNIYEWLSKEIIDSRKFIMNYLTDTNKYSEVISDNSMSYQYQNKLLPLKGLSFSNVVLSQGSKDLEEYVKISNEYSFKNVHFQMKYSLLAQLENIFNIENKIYIIQETSLNSIDYQYLREVDRAIYNLFNDCEIIPTYDICMLKSTSDTESIEDIAPSEAIVMGIDCDKLIDRLLLINKSKKIVPNLSNVVQVYDEEMKVSTIKLIFKGIDKFDKTSELIGLKFISQDGSDLDLDYELKDNSIVIDLRVKSLEQNVIEEESISYYNLAKIYYAYDNFIYECNLKSDDIPCLPFIVEMLEN